jgi:hypothetical protein
LIAMRALPMTGIVGALAAFALALALTGATGAAFARSGGGGGAWQGGGVGSHGAGGHGGDHHYPGSIRTGGRFHGFDGPGEHDRHDHDHEGHDHDHEGHDHDHDHDGHDRFGHDGHDRNPDFGFAYSGEHWGGFLSGDGFAGWPGLSLFRRYGDGDAQHCLRRDVYGDLYPAC